MTEAVLAVDLTCNRIAEAVLDRDGKILVRRTERLETYSPEPALRQIGRIAGELAKIGRGYRLVAAGIALDEIVGRDGTLKSEVETWDKLSLARRASQRLKMPVAIETTCRAAILGECWRGFGRGKADVILLQVGQKIQAAILASGKLLRGAHDLAGGAGWMAVSEADGFEVRKFGGLEAFTSAAGVVRAAKNAIDAGFGGAMAEYVAEAFTAEDVAELARRGDLAARQIFRRIGKTLGLAVANLISLCDPQVVVLGGELMAASDLFWDELANTAVGRCQPLASRKVRLRISGLGADAPLLGVGHLAWNLLEKPEEKVLEEKRNGTAPGGFSHRQTKSAKKFSLAVAR